MVKFKMTKKCAISEYGDSGWPIIPTLGRKK